MASNSNLKELQQLTMLLTQGQKPAKAEKEETQIEDNSTNSDSDEVEQQVEVKKEKKEEMKTPEEQEAWDVEMARLWNLNFYAGILHFTQGAYQFYLSQTNDDYKAVQTPMWWLTVKYVNDDWTQGMEQARSDIDRWRTLEYCSYFGLMSAVSHFAILYFWDKYQKDLAKSQQRFRWWEYQVSASLIITILFTFWGNFDYFQVFGCFVISGMCIQFGDTHEILNSGVTDAKKINWKGFWYGAYCGVLPWIIMWSEIARIIYKYNIDFDLIPWYVWAILVEYFLLFWCFPINMIFTYLQWGMFNNKKYPNLKNGGYLAGERTYIWLSFISKTMILWQVGLGVIIRADEDRARPVRDNI